jgi:hypothetical protein
MCRNDGSWIASCNRMHLAELNGTEQQEFTATRLGPGRADGMKPGSYSKCRHRLALPKHITPRSSDDSWLKLLQSTKDTQINCLPVPRWSFYRSNRSRGEAAFSLPLGGLVLDGWEREKVAHAHLSLLLVAALPFPVGPRFLFAARPGAAGGRGEGGSVCGPGRGGRW